MAGMKDRWLDFALFVFASPILLARALRRAVERGRFVHTAMLEQIVCECGASVSLVGLWRCGCGFTYRGHLLRTCPVCHTVPILVRCYRCGVTTKLPEAS
jgi:formate dehydrogenase maturation protein FdhE